jgi:hypothetical protein
MGTQTTAGSENKTHWTDHWKRTSNQLQRLERALAHTWARLEADQPGKSSSPVVSLLNEASNALKQRDPDVGWARLHAALELECLDYDEDDVEAASARLHAELRTGVITGWEAAAVRSLLEKLELDTHPAPSQTSATDRDSRLRHNRRYVRQATKVRNVYFGGAYYVERIIAQRRLILVCFGMGLLVVALVVGRWASDGRSEWDYRIAIASAIAGMIGAVASASQRLVAHPSTAASTDLGSFTAVVVRLFIGAVAALSVHVAVLSGFIVFPGKENASLILASFGVGFAERLVIYHPPQAGAASQSPAPSTGR